MHEPSLPGAADRLAPHDPSGLQRRLIAILQSSPAPTVCVSGSATAGTDVMLAGATLLELIRYRVARLQHAGMRRGDILASDALGASRAIDALASLLGGFVYWPCIDHRRASIGPHVTDSGATLVWRPNPLIGVSFAPGIAHDAPAALPMRLSVRLRNAMQPAGAHVRMLVDGGADGLPVPVNAQTIARLGSTLRRKLALRQQTVRYCAAPLQSAAGVLLDLLPGIAARQVMVVPDDALPSAATIACAIVRYRPDHVTLTTAQAVALLELTHDEPTRDAMRTLHLLVADTHPVPRALRATLSAFMAEVRVAYVLPEAGDVVVM
jgi:hypothetical protein